MAETPNKDNSTSATQGDKRQAAPSEERREAVSSTMSDLEQDGRGINTATGGLKNTANGAQVTFAGTMVKLDADGHPVLTDRLVRDEKIQHIPNPDHMNTFQW